MAWGEGIGDEGATVMLAFFAILIGAPIVSMIWLIATEGYLSALFFLALVGGLLWMTAQACYDSDAPENPG